jgi:hypothetical protein
MSRPVINIEAASKAVIDLAAPGAIDRLLAAKKMAVAADATDSDKVRLLLTGVKSQGDFSAAIINATHGEGKALTAEELTIALKMAFPTAGVGKRHGPHYLCLARTGKLAGVAKMAPIPFAKRERKAKPADAASPVATAPVAGAVAAPQAPAEAVVDLSSSSPDPAPAAEAPAKKLTKAERRAQKGATRA